MYSIALSVFKALAPYLNHFFTPSIAWSTNISNHSFGDLPLIFVPSIANPIANPSATPTTVPTPGAIAVPTAAPSLPEAIVPPASIATFMTASETVS